LLLAADGTALAVSQSWSVLSGLTEDSSRVDGWVSAVEPLDRGILRARLRDAAAAGQAGYADVRLTGRPDGRWSRWWWRPASARRLLVCVAELGDFQGRDALWPSGRPPARLVHPGEFLNLARRALRRRSHHGEDVAVVAVRLNGIAGAGTGGEPDSGLLRVTAERITAATGSAGVAAEIAPGEFVILLDGLHAAERAAIIASRVLAALGEPLEADGTPVQVTPIAGVAVAGRSDLSPEELIENASRAGRSAADVADHDWPDLAGILIERLFSAGVALHSASALAEAPVTDLLQQVLELLDGIIADIRTAVFQSQLPERR
jgi:GGDEF domain-containing protein